MEVSLFRSAEDRHPAPATWSLTELAGRLSAFDVHPNLTDKRRLPAWSACVYAPRATRAAANVVAMTAIVLDIDQGATVDQVWALYPGHARVLHTSWSHTPAAPKVRLVVPLARPVPVAAWSRVWTWAAISARRRGVQVDAQCPDASRLWFLPAVASHDVVREARVELALPLYDAPWESLPDPLAAQQAVRAARAPLVVPNGARRPSERPFVDALDRERLGREVGRLAGAGDNLRADRIRCPRCDRPSVFFWIRPRSLNVARCDHQRSCGWYGPLGALNAAR